MKRIRVEMKSSGFDFDDKLLVGFEVVVPEDHMNEFGRFLRMYPSSPGVMFSVTEIYPAMPADEPLRVPAGGGP